jgi:hypothetical protein
MQVQTYRGELLGDVGGVRVHNLSQQQFGSDRNNLCSHMSFFPSGRRWPQMNAGTASLPKETRHKRPMTQLRIKYVM